MKRVKSALIELCQSKKNRTRPWNVIKIGRMEEMKKRIFVESGRWNLTINLLEACSPFFIPHSNSDGNGNWFIIYLNFLIAEKPSLITKERSLFRFILPGNLSENYRGISSSGDGLGLVRTGNRSPLTAYVNL